MVENDFTSSNLLHDITPSHHSHDMIDRSGCQKGDEGERGVEKLVDGGRGRGRRRRMMRGEFDDV